MVLWGMSKPTIQGITLSVDISDKDYGSGVKAFTSLQAKYPEEGQSMDNLGDVVSDGLDLYLTAWSTLLAGRFSTGKITSEEFKDTLSKVTLRIEKTKKYLSKVGQDDNAGQ